MDDLKDIKKVWFKKKELKHERACLGLKKKMQLSKDICWCQRMGKMTRQSNLGYQFRCTKAKNVQEKQCDV